jgi:hypothetical protein
MSILMSFTSGCTSILTQLRTLKSYLLIGTVIGASSFVLAELMLPAQAGTVLEHDTMLTQRLSLIYCPIAASFFAWHIAGRASALWKGLVIGTLAGAAFQFLSAWDFTFLTKLLLFPAVVSAFISVLLPIMVNLPSGPMTALRRCSNGLIAGFLLGLTYEILINIALGCLVIIGLAQYHVTSEPEYLSGISYFGPIAFALANTAYFFLMHKTLREQQPLHSSISRECARLLALLGALTILVHWKSIVGYFR